MRLETLSFLLALFYAAPAGHSAGVEWVPDLSPQALFEGKARQVRAAFKNGGSVDVEIKLITRLWQTSSTTAFPVGQAQARRPLRIPAGETILEAVPLDLPEVRGRTSFLLEWADEQNKIVAKTSLIVFPSKLLRELKVLAGEAGVGILDPRNVFKPWLKKSEVNYTDLESTELESFTGRLIIFDGGTGERAQTNARLLSKARKGNSVLWILHTKEPRLEPSSFLKTTSRAAMVITDSSNFTDFENDPIAHLNLTRLARWAVLGDSMDLIADAIH
jgi:hypothetical protein